MIVPTGMREAHGEPTRGGAIVMTLCDHGVEEQGGQRLGDQRAHQAVADQVNLVGLRR